jgi:hypothetical protein
MFNWFYRLSFRNKNKYLLIAAVVFAFMIWSMTIKKTFALVAECKELKSRAELIANAPVEGQVLTKNLQKLDVLLSKGQRAEGNIQQILLSVISGYCQANNVLLREIPKTTITKEKDYLVETNIFVVEGGFRKLLELIYLLEQQNRIGKVASVNFMSRTDSRTGKNILALSIYIQNVKKMTNENVS